jgi:hypothetical protein
MQKVWKLFVTLLVVTLLAFLFVMPATAAAAASPPGQPAQSVTVAMTPELLIGFASVILAVLFDWLPGLKSWYDKYSDGAKRGLMAGLLVLVTGGAFGLGCAGWIQAGWACSGVGIQGAVYLLVIAVAINQGIHSLTKP